jgi:hypothetical protein
MRFNYNTAECGAPNGLAVGHKYSTISTNGLLALGSIITTATNETGTKSLPYLKFEYRNCPYGGLYRHDLFGYNAASDIRRSLGPPYYPEYPVGQSEVGSASAPKAEAWSILRVRRGTGSVEEYEYEPNEATMLSTNEQFTTATTPLRPGIRVKSHRIYDGVRPVALTKGYSYGTGYCTYDFVLANGLSGLPSFLNSGSHKLVSNVMIFSNVGIEYAQSTESSPSRGRVVTDYLCPSDVLVQYLSTELRPLRDAMVIDESGTQWNAVNSYAHYRGQVRQISN